MEKYTALEYEKYVSEGFKALRCKGYHPKYNPEKDYKTAKEAVDAGFTKEDFTGLSIQKIEEWEETGGWIGWLIPKGYIVIDIEDKEGIKYIKSLCEKLNITPPEHNTNQGKHFFFRLKEKLPAASEVFVKCGLKVTYRIGSKNYLILSPTNGRSWEVSL